jgi:two-component system chemotaxis response regulator CheB
VARKIITSVLANEPEVDVVGTASESAEAREKIFSIKPDLVLLDLEMPKLDGLSLLKLIMRYRPMPVVILSSSAHPGSPRAAECAAAGAKAVMLKPDGPFSTADIQHLIGLIRKSASALPPQPAPSRETARETAREPAPPVPPSPVRPKPLLASSEHHHQRSIILLGASTGGTEALKDVLAQLPDGLPPICIVQHIPAKFSTAFAGRLNQLCQFNVHEAVDREVLRPGTAVVAPGGYHLTIAWNGSGYTAHLNQDPLVHYQRPAVDNLFESAVAAGAGPHAVAALLTGMGSDGATGLLSLRQAGARTIAQSESSCVVFGMPREAIKLGAAQHVVDLPQIAGAILRNLQSTPALATAG